MPLLSYSVEFADLVASGAKRQTIRGYRKDGRDPKVGDRLYLYTGMRTKACRKLGEAVCSSTRRVELNRNGALAVGGLGYKRPAFDRFARADGFVGMDEMIAWFEKTHGLPFEGLLIRWGDVEHPAPEAQR